MCSTATSDSTTCKWLIIGDTAQNQGKE